MTRANTSISSGVYVRSKRHVYRKVTPPATQLLQVHRPPAFTNPHYHVETQDNQYPLAPPKYSMDFWDEITDLLSEPVEEIEPLWQSSEATATRDHLLRELASIQVHSI
ncbi:hypothetical protein SPRG_16364 [Saprolegnia parasitica CBS 223.65]|uniref:Uncharacterized protein n=1 Tax=Saprolegnia parasitica (strain CBS 223.65) TaxID=695850 RepID=A0A067BJ71_SAPPC|nr:hypothetical protein SPRG_16364 [Saprolegnia parasitica CBS 223.65]KDO18193.1 hypothetical protein SPRG_16364 [Saprolegnia parasitica CBS 223.65]|eukprot:XP_012211106.1 hypothetical protein SPRG_16364 [Saprolegnia parasitica CBS 223.65]